MTPVKLSAIENEGDSECERVNEDVGNDATRVHYGECKNECVASCMHGCVST